MKKHRILFAACLVGLLALSGCGGESASPSDDAQATTSATTSATESTQETQYGPLSIGDEAPDFTLALAEGGEITLSELRGQVVVLNFWATYCGPCVGELPELQELAQNYKDQNVYLLAVNCGEDAGKVRDFLTEQKLSLNVALDTEMDAQEKYPANGIPYTVFVDPQGKVAYIQPGAYREDNYGHLATALDEVLKQSADSNTAA